MDGTRPRLLVVITLAEVGGAQTYLMSLLPALTERYDVTVAAHGPGPLVDAGAGAGARHVPLRHVRRPRGTGNGKAKLVSVGRLRTPKDFATFARSLKALEPGTYEAQIVGDGPDRPLVEAAIRQSGLNGGLRLLGQRNDVPELLAG